jgi:hypothetical protein
VAAIHIDRPAYDIAANARLIAAAPDMLGALERLMQHEPVREDFQVTRKGALQFESAMSDFSLAKAVIARAKGEAK